MSTTLGKEVIPMSTSTLTPVLPALDPAVGNEIGDEILLSTAKQEKVATVKAVGGRSTLQSHSARAWTLGGNVD